MAAARRATLGAFESQGPRLARFLEALSQAVPEEIVITSIAVTGDGMQWQASVNGMAVTEDAATGQAVVNAMLRRLGESPFAGAPVQPPSLRVVSGAGAARADGPADAQTMVIPEGMSGVEFVLQFALAK
jgi:hypothetical protein